MLAARRFQTDGWTLWTAPAHPDRPAWDAALTDAVRDRGEALARTLGIDSPI